jgi:uncharacterized iron-regulated membrane protein
MSVTGTLLTFQQSVLGFVERSQRVVVLPADGRRLDLDALLAGVRSAVPGAQPATVTLDSDPAAAAQVSLGAQGIVFVNPYTGEVLGTGSASARAFYRSVTNWHRYLAVDGERRAAARAITGACNAAFLVLAITGLYIWWPRQWSARHLAPIVFFRRGLRGKARDFNWHNTIGFWCAPVLIVLTASGMVISYTWASNLVYTMTGSPRPAAAGRGAGPVASAAESPGRGGGRGAGRDGRGPARAAVDRQSGRPAAPLSLAAVPDLAERRLPTWKTMIVRLPTPAGAPVSVTMSDRNHWNSFARSTLTLDASTGADVRWEPYDQGSRGQKLRGWLRFAHTGELGGRAGEAVAGLASAGGAFLVYTGISLALRRLAAWRARRRASLPTEASHAA